MHLLRSGGFIAARQRCIVVPHTVWERVKGAILFRKREWPLWNPKRKDEGPSPSTPHIGSLGLEELHALRNRVRCTWLRHESLHFVTALNRALLP